jgi:nucleoside-diphosphate-sugar epimerase
MKIFITGGTGFIGKYVVQELLSKGHELLVNSDIPGNQSDNGLRFIVGNLNEIDHWWPEVIRFAPDAAIHLAWEGIPDYSAKMSEVNLTHGLRLYRLLGQAGCKKILSSGSCWEYGLFKGCLHESQPVYPYNAFTAAKNALHFLGKEIAAEYEMSFIWTRLFYVYGPGQRAQSLIPFIINEVLSGRELKLKSVNDQLDFIYVEDVAKAFDLILSNECSHSVYNIGSGRKTAVKEIVKIIYQKLQKPLPALTDQGEENAGTIKDFYANRDQIISDFNIGTCTDINEGIEKFIKHIIV